MARKASSKSAKVATASPASRGKSNKAGAASADAGASAEIDQQIQELGDWRGEILARFRRLIRQAVPAVVEEVKWRKSSNDMRGVPVWSHAGILCTGETYKEKVKFTFAHGAELHDPHGLFNASLTGNTRRAIDLYEGDRLSASAFKTLVRAAAARNAAAQTGK